MRKEDLSKAIGGIDPKLVESSMAYRPAMSKHRLIKIVALAACLAVIVTAIPLSLIMNREDQVEASETTVASDTTLLPSKDSTTSGNSDTVIVDPQPLKVIYCDASSVSPEYLETTVFKDKNIKVEDFKRFHYSLEWKEEFGTIDWTPDIPEKLTLSLSNKEYTATFDIAYSSSNTDNEVLNEYAKIARYKIEGTEDKFIYYRVNTKTIIHVDDLPRDKYGISSYEEYTPKYTEEEITELAYQDIKSIYGEEIFEKYSTTSCFSLRGIYYIVRLQWMIGDFDTDSHIDLTYTGEGDLVRIVTDSFGAYDFTEHLLTEEKLLEVDKVAQELVGENLVHEKKLMIHVDGYMCVRYVIYYEIEGTLNSADIFFRL